MPVHDSSRLHPNHPQDPPTEAKNRGLALFAVCMCALTTGIDMTITNVALPFISRELDAGTSALQWVVDAFTIGMSGLLVVGGGLGDRLGRRKIFLAGYTLFGLACVLAAFSPNVGTLVAARGLMGVGSGIGIAPALAILSGIYPPAERGRAIGVWAVAGASGLTIGPIMGGFLLDAFWWGSVFLVNVPLVAVGVLVGRAVLPETTKPGDAPLDLRGAALSIIGLTGVLFAVIEGPSRGWLAPEVVGAAVIGVLAIVAFVRVEMHAEAPMFDVRVFNRPAVAAGAVTLFVSYAVFNGMLFLVPQFLQEVEDVSIVDVGLLMAPFAVVFGICSTKVTAAVERLGARTVIAGGLLGCAIGTAVLAPGLSIGVTATIVATAIIGAALSGLIAPASTVVMNGLPKEKAGEGSSLNMVSRTVGGSISVGVVGSILASVYAPRVSDVVGGLSGAEAATAESSISGAVEVSSSLDASAASKLVDTAGDAFVLGSQIGLAIITVLAVGAAIWAWRAIPDER